jgi:hypothetical protein
MSAQKARKREDEPEKHTCCNKAKTQKVAAATRVFAIVRRDVWLIALTWMLNAMINRSCQAQYGFQ